MRNGKNVWINSDLDSDDLGQMVKATPDELPEGQWQAAYAESRVNGDTYTPYQGGDEWSQNANAAMAREANYNFRTKDGH